MYIIYYEKAGFKKNKLILFKNVSIKHEYIYIIIKCCKNNSYSQYSYTNILICYFKFLKYLKIPELSVYFNIWRLNRITSR